MVIFVTGGIITDTTDPFPWGLCIIHTKKKIALFTNIDGEEQFTADNNK
jgi:hypothetical protein